MKTSFSLQTTSSSYYRSKKFIVLPVNRTLNFHDQKQSILFNVWNTSLANYIQFYVIFALCLNPPICPPICKQNIQSLMP